jgi:hypothetical protein
MKITRILTDGVELPLREGPYKWSGRNLSSEMLETLCCRHPATPLSTFSGELQLPVYFCFFLNFTR